jgi:hypothetical protein
MNFLSLFQARLLGLGEARQIARIHGSKRDETKGRGVDVDAGDAIGCDPSQLR